MGEGRQELGDGLSSWCRVIWRHIFNLKKRGSAAGPAAAPQSRGSPRSPLVLSLEQSERLVSENKAARSASDDVGACAACPLTLLVSFGNQRARSGQDASSLHAPPTPHVHDGVTSGMDPSMWLVDVCRSPPMMEKGAGGRRSAPPGDDMIYDPVDMEAAGPLDKAQG